MSGITYDVIVVGAGVEGSSTAYSLVKDGYKTLLLEKFPLPHARGSSHGHSRITRLSYDQDYYAKMMPTSFRMWSELEKAENTTIYEQSGLITFGPNDKKKELQQTIDALRSINAPHDVLDSEALEKRFPMFKLDGRYSGVYDPSGGVLRADRALAAYWSQIRRNGGTICDGEAVTQITPGETVTVTTSKSRYRAKSIVLCVGPWTSQILAPLGLKLPLDPVRVGVYYWKADTDQFELKNGMPTVIVIEVFKRGLGLYGLPALEYPGHFKFCYHGGATIDPNDRDCRPAMDTEKVINEKMSNFVKNHCPALKPVPSIQECCIYTNTPDDDFILDTHPKWKNIIIGAGFSGHGFKLAPVVGKLLSELATERSTSFDMSPFKIQRFNNKAKL